MFLLVLSLTGCREKHVPEAIAPKVVVARVGQQDVPLYREYTGVTEASIKVTLIARVSGFLEKMLFVPGDIVREGQKVFVIEQTQYKADVEIAEANLEKAKSSVIYYELVYLRYKGLLATKAVSAEEFDQARDNYDQAKANVLEMQAQLDIAKLNYSYTEVFSPVTGKISRNLVDPGNVVAYSPQQETELATVTKMDPIFVYFQISDSDFGDVIRMRKAERKDSETKEIMQTQPVRGGFEMSLMEKPYGTQADPAGFWQYKGQVTYDDNTIDRSTGTITLRGEIANPDYEIYPGWICRVRIPYRVAKGALLVHEEAVAIDLDSRYMLIVGENNVVERRKVEVGEMAGDNMLIINSGVKAGETYILEGLQKAKVGKPVSPMAPPPQPKT